MSAKYNFESDFQTKLAAQCCRNIEFVRKTNGIINPSYFENDAEAFLVDIVLKYHRKYDQIPDKTVFVDIIKKTIAGRDRSFIDSVTNAYKNINKQDLSGADYIADQVLPFAIYQGIADAMVEGVSIMEDALAKGDMEQFYEIKNKMDEAFSIGLREDTGSVNYFDDIDDRSEYRQDFAEGKIKKTGITTGYSPIDRILHHGGFGRGELSVIMGAPASGKSLHLIDFTKHAALAGHNVLFITLEVSSQITVDRLDANVTDVKFAELVQERDKVRDRINSLSGKTGRLVVHEYPSGTLSPSGIVRLLERYKSQGILFDAVYVDYLDIMRPDIRTTDKIENSKSVWVDTRAIAQKNNLAMITATQTNREGMQNQTAGMEHTSEDINKARTSDLLITINKTEEEMQRGQARLFFAKSRNQRGGFTIHVEQDLAKMKPITNITNIT